MQWIDGEPEGPKQTMAAPQIVDDPLHVRIENSQPDLDEAKERLLAHLQDVDSAEADKEKAKIVLAGLITRREELEKEQQALEAKGALKGIKLEEANLSAAEVRARSKKLLEEIKKLEEMPASTKQLKYHSPVSRPVAGEELMFECRAGRVTFIDMPMFMQEVKGSMEAISVELRTTYRVERRTGGDRAVSPVLRRRAGAQPGSKRPACRQRARFATA